MSVTSNIELLTNQTTWSGILPMPISDGVTLQGVSSGVVSKMVGIELPINNDRSYSNIRSRL
ncbi:MAG: hypothetical protein IPG39_02240 [Bacteroidetes bacterium]|nr:hypothetical protein [Bacteroidota bacterium]